MRTRTSTGATTLPFARMVATDRSMRGYIGSWRKEATVITSPTQVHSADVEALLGCAEELTRSEHRRLVRLVTVGEERHAPAIGREVQIGRASCRERV